MTTEASDRQSFHRIIAGDVQRGRSRRRLNEEGPSTGVACRPQTATRRPASPVIPIMAAYEKLKTRTRDDYLFILDYRTRWADNDQYVCASVSLVYHNLG